MAINSFPPAGGSGGYEFPSELIDPVSKFRVSNPENLIDTDFEYGLQPTKWETVELINNTPSFFSKSGDTTIDGISSIITNAGTREIIVKTELDHGLAVGIPINVTGTKSITADGSYIINSIPDTKTFTYLCKDDQVETASILDLYSSIITGEFFQGSQLRVSDSEGIITDAAGTSELTVTTNSTHGFGVNTPFYFLNLNSTVAQEFQAANTASKTFDASNSATAQTFDGSNTLSSFNIDWSNSAVEGGTVSNITSTDTANSRITVSHTTENFSNLALGTPLYYNISATSGYFNTNPRGVLFLKTTTSLGTSTSTFQVSLVPDGEPILFTTSLSGTFQIANQARTFAGNNVNPLTQTNITIIKDPEIPFDGGNQGFAGEFSINGLSTISGITSGVFSITTTAGAGLDYYPGAMLKYSSTGAGATGLNKDATYFVNTFTTTGTPDLYEITITELPGIGPNISASGGTGTQTFQKIGVSIDKDIVHARNASFSERDMVKYSFPTDGRFETETSEESKIFYFVAKAYDSHNFELNEALFAPTVATGGVEATHTSFGVTYKTHTFPVGTSTFAVASIGTEPTARFIMVGGGGAGAARHGGGGGAGGFIEGALTLTPGNYTVVVGAGGAGKFADQQGNDGGNTTFNGLTSLGGGGGGSWDNGQRNGRPGGSGGGGSEVAPGAGGAATQPGSASGGFGFAGAQSQQNGTGHGSGGGGAGGVGTRGFDSHAGPGGPGRRSNILGRTLWFAGGGGAGSWEAGEPRRGGNGGVGGGGGGGQARSGETGLGGGISINSGLNGTVGVPNSTGGDAGAQTGAGGGGGGAYPPNTEYGSTRGGAGGSGVVIIRYLLSPLEAPLTYTSATGGTITQETESGITYNVHTFSTPGQSTFTVSELGTTPYVEIFAYGAGGGGGQVGGWSYGSYGGAGAFATARHPLTIAKSYAVMVGGGGANAEGTNNGLSSNVFTAGGGAPSRPDTGDDRYSGQGGGLSGFFDNNTYNAANAILIAGGGGGGGSSRAQIGNIGGAGGGLVGEDGKAPYQGQAYAGKGGTQTAGGANVTAGTGNSTLPTQLAGGITGSYGGGGGGGWWGGSAGSYVEPNTMGGGGGGSSYAHPTKTEFASLVGGSGLYPPQAGSRSTSQAFGGLVASPGGNGIVVIRYPIAVTI
jgi:hypothetical protein